MHDELIEHTSVLFKELKAHCVEIGIVVNKMKKTTKIYKVTRFIKNMKLKQF